MPKKKKKKEQKEVDLNVIPLRPLEMKDELDFHPNLPKIERNNGSITLLLGSTASGKTCCINWLLLNSNAWGDGEGAFENVYVFSPSIDCCDSSRWLREYFECYSEYKDSHLKSIMARQETFPKKDRPKGMIVIDDSVGNSAMKRGGTLQSFLSRYRHWNMNVRMSVQSFRALSTIARANATDAIIFNGIYNMKEWEKIEEEYGDMYKGSLRKCYQKYAPNKYDFITLKLRDNPPRMLQGFHTEIDYGRHSTGLGAENNDSDEEL